VARKGPDCLGAGGGTGKVWIAQGAERGWCTAAGVFTSARCWGLVRRAKARWGRTLRNPDRSDRVVAPLFGTESWGGALLEACSPWVTFSSEASPWLWVQLASPSLPGSDALPRPYKAPAGMTKGGSALLFSPV